MMKIAGIEYSLTSPAICVWKETDDNRQFNFNMCTIHYLETAQRLRRATEHEILNLCPEVYPEWDTEEQRHDLLSEWAIKCVKGCYVFIEGYAFATYSNTKCINQINHLHQYHLQLSRNLLLIRVMQIKK